MTIDFAALAAPFAANAIHWRAQTMNKEGTSAMALAYIDARDVQDRLDTVCGPANWSDSYTETPKGRLICTLSLRHDDEWISKSDGAGDTDVEGDKGAISDALKRAAVKWGIGRHLYDMPVTWADCESYEKNGKKHWKKWTDAGLRKLSAVRVTGAPPRSIAAEPTGPALITDAQRGEIIALAEAAGVQALAIIQAEKIADLRQLPADRFDAVKRRLNLTIDKNAQAREAA